MSPERPGLTLEPPKDTDCHACDDPPARRIVGRTVGDSGIPCTSPLELCEAHLEELRKLLDGGAIPMTDERAVARAEKRPT